MHWNIKILKLLLQMYQTISNSFFSHILFFFKNFGFD